MVIQSRIIHLDLDGVLADFRKRFVAVAGRQPEESSVDEMWARVASVNELFLGLEVTAEGRELFTFVRTLGEVRILTALPRKTTYPTAVVEKLRWVALHFGDVPIVTVQYARQKADHARPHDILIDDSAENVRRWVKAGGHGIVHADLDSTVAALLEIAGPRP